jgi:hypothetical protein
MNKAAYIQTNVLTIRNIFANSENICKFSELISLQMTDLNENYMTVSTFNKLFRFIPDNYPKV